MKDLPLISCLCVSQNRPAFLKNSIGYFLGQTYPHKELVVVYEGKDNPEKLIPEDALSKIRIIHISSPDLSLGERRNISIENCKGEYFCQWDDDDWCHQRRLEVQMNSLLSSGYDACILERWIMYDGIKMEVYLSSKRPWEASLLCKRKIFNEVLRYPHLNKGEDNDFVVKLIKRDCVHFLLAPHLYSYVYHGRNTGDSDHFQSLFNAGRKLISASGLLMGEILKGEYTQEKASELVEDEKFLTVVE